MIREAERHRGSGGGDGVGLSPYVLPVDPTPQVAPAGWPIGPTGRVVEPEDGDNPPEVTGPGEEGTA